MDSYRYIRVLIGREHPIPIDSATMWSDWDIPATHHICSCRIFSPIHCVSNIYPNTIHPRIQEKTRELLELQVKEREYAEIQDVVSRTFSSDEEHTYAGIGSLGSSQDSSSVDAYSHPYHLPQSPQSSQSPHAPLNLQSNGPPLEALYAQVNKHRNARPAAPDR